VLKFNEKGEVLETMWDLGGQNHPMITSMREHRGSLYLGGLMNNRIGRLVLDGADPDFVQYERRWGRRP
jgi:ribose transport system permease protein